MPVQNFFSQDLKLTRKSIKDIEDSYNNEWDILAELCQNAVDAVRKLSTDNGLIELDVDASRKMISIRDNGIGITPEKLVAHFLLTKTMMKL